MQTQITRRKFGKLSSLAMAAALLPLELLTGCPGEDIVLAGLRAAAQIAAAAAGVLKPLNTTAGGILDTVSSDLLLIVNLYDQWKAADALGKPDVLHRIQTAIATISQNLTAILKAVKIANPALVAYISVGIGVVNSAISILIAHLPAQQKSLIASVAAQERAVLPVVAGAKSEKDLKRAWNDASIQAGHPEAVVR